VLPPTWTKTPLPGISFFAIGHGYSPLLLVVIVPEIVSSKYISTALGAHKSQTGAAIFQTLSGILLDIKGPGNKRSEISLQYLLDTFLTLNVLEILSLILLVYLLRVKSASSRSRSSTRASTVDASRTHISSGELRALEQEALLAHDDNIGYSSPDPSHVRFSREIGKSEVKRGEIMSFSSTTVIILAWILFIATAWVKLTPPNGG